MKIHDNLIYKNKMENIQTVKRDLLILCKKNNINRIRLNINNVLYIIDKTGNKADICIIDGNNIIRENINLPKPRFCKAKTLSGKKCRNKTYDNFCHLH